ncbi:MAG TPA: SBBP repeat-containing protein [bacterium]|nr:SBBP repeat-containing protein [bacterium]
MVRRWLALLIVFALAAGGLGTAGKNLHINKAYTGLPLTFEANLGQTDPQVRFVSRGRDHALFLTSTEMVIVLAPKRTRQGVFSGRGASPGRPDGEAPRVLRMKFAGTNPGPRVSGLDEFSGKTNYFIGNDPAQWHTNIPTYARVQYEGLYPGIDLSFYGNQRQLEYDYVVHPGADPSKISLEFQGAQTLVVDNRGDLALQMRDDMVWHLKPVFYQNVAGVRREISGRYVLKTPHQVGFQVGAYDPRRPLVIDPVLLAGSTYLGGSGDDLGYAIVVDSAGSAYVTGTTSSANFPTTAGVYKTTEPGGLPGGYHVFVTKIDAGGAPVYSTYLGGNVEEIGYGIAVDGSGNAYVTGATDSTNFPTTAGAYGGGVDAFVTKLNPSGSALIYSTYLGGSGDDWGQGIAVDGSGAAYVTGHTSSTNFPTANAFQATYGGGASDAFVAKINPSGTALVYSTYLGGSGDESMPIPSGGLPPLGPSIAVDGSGSAYVTGTTTSTNFPTTAGAFRTTSLGGGFHVFVTKFSSTGPRVYSTYLGGNNNEVGFGVAVDGSGNAYVTGATNSSNFPTTAGAFQKVLGGSINAFVTKFNPSGSAPIYSTYLGGAANDWGQGIALDVSGNAYVTGYTSSANFPTANAFQTTYGGGTNNAFVTEFNSSGAAVVYSTYLGGSGDDQGHSIAVDHSGNAYVTGSTTSTNFPTTSGAFQKTSAGVSPSVHDAFVATIAQGTPPPPPPPPIPNVPLPPLPPLPPPLPPPPPIPI